MITNDFEIYKTGGGDDASASLAFLFVALVASISVVCILFFRHLWNHFFHFHCNLHIVPHETCRHLLRQGFKSGLLCSVMGFNYRNYICDLFEFLFLLVQILLSIPGLIV